MIRLTSIIISENYVSPNLNLNRYTDFTLLDYLTNAEDRAVPLNS